MMRVYCACWFSLSSWRFSWLVVRVAVLSVGLVASWAEIDARLKTLDESSPGTRSFCANANGYEPPGPRCSGRGPRVRSPRRTWRRISLSIRGRVRVRSRRRSASRRAGSPRICFAARRRSFVSRADGWYLREKPRRAGELARCLDRRWRRSRRTPSRCCAVATSIWCPGLAEQYARAGRPA